MTIGQPQNAYVVIPPWSNEQIIWNPHDPGELPMPDCRYLRGAFIAMEETATVSGLTFYITSRLDTLPSYGPNVVVVCLSDEWCRVPAYALNVRAIFKTYGTALAINWRALLRPSIYEMLALIQDIRTQIYRLPSFATFGVQVLGRLLRRKRPLWHIYDMPLGFFNQVTVPFIPIDQRRFDVYFAGSAANRKSKPSLSDRLKPKFVSRVRMLKELQAIAERSPHLNISTTVTSGFGRDSAIDYSSMMMQTKICLVPRGTSLETYRYFEGLRFGCVVIAERLPKRWFYDGAPTLCIDGWNQLGRIISTVASDPVRLSTLSVASLQWWNEHCSESALGRYFATKLAQTR